MEATYLLIKHYADLFTSEVSDVYWLIVSAAWGTMRLFEARSSVYVEDYDWGFGQILPVFLLLGPIVMTIQTVILPDDVAKEAGGDNISHSPDSVSNVPAQHNGIKFTDGFPHGTFQSTNRSESTAGIPLEELPSSSHHQVPCTEQSGTSLVPSAPVAAGTPRPPDAQHLDEADNAEHMDRTDSIRPGAVPVLDETDIRVVLDTCYRGKSRTAVIASLTFCQVIVVTVSFFLDRSVIRSKITSIMAFYFTTVFIIQPFYCFCLILTGMIPEGTPRGTTGPYSRPLSVGWFSFFFCLVCTVNFTSIIFTFPYLLMGLQFGIPARLAIFQASIRLGLRPITGDRQSTVLA
ncbi:hypothetical protein B0T21DRAFT_112744 [Apiosordaria backusii]|uniref:Uncharacterized protein n=1 Tax=Apiosordaria backusii TaxID=314023 RepID=A0AA39ZRQ2_9PEZI|nr:hypothetical protein B0T21DRAFT_112744 [Apiosordaria backusii]